MIGWPEPRGYYHGPWEVAKSSRIRRGDGGDGLVARVSSPQSTVWLQASNPSFPSPRSFSVLPPIDSHPTAGCISSPSLEVEVLIAFLNMGERLTQNAAYGDMIETTSSPSCTPLSHLPASCLVRISQSGSTNNSIRLPAPLNSISFNLPAQSPWPHQR
jgi:hypothetical protein